MSKTLRKKLKTATVEKDVESAYRAELSTERPQTTWTSPHGTDGVADWTQGPATVRLLLEAKYDRKFKDRNVACGVLGQVLLYLKKFERVGDTMPNVLLVGDRKECFILATKAVQNFMSLDVNWNAAPSTGDPALTLALVQGVNILPWMHDVNTFDFKDLVTEVEALAEGRVKITEATETNLAAMFNYWRDNVFRVGRGAHALTPVEQVDVFLRCLFQPGEVEQRKRGILTVPGYPAGVLVNPDQYGSFFTQFQQGYKAEQIATFMSMKDRLVEDDARRRQGAFFTPRIWVDEAHREVTRVLGDSWRKDCVVWDPAAGTANLTRDYDDWGLLVSSTAERPDVGAMKQHRWGGHYVFQYDFLNPGADSPFFEEHEHNLVPPNADKALRKAASEGKRLVFFMNPPYAEDGDVNVKGNTKAGVAAETKVAEDCRRVGLGRTSRQLYAQFMFQCAQTAKEYGFKNYTVALFSKPTFMSSGSYRPFREWWYKKHAYQGGFLFQASHFADVSGAWGVSFTVWSSGSSTLTTKDHPVRLCDVEDFAVVTDAMKHVYSSDGREASEWVEDSQKGHEGDTPKFSSGLKVSEKWCGGSDYRSLGVSVSVGNNLMKSATDVYMLSGKPTHKGARHFDLLPSNWRRAVALYGARKLVAGTWINDKDEYLAPNESLPNYGQWVDDCHVYALLHTSNNCTAMREVVYKGESWRIKNHWFWRTRAQALDALDTHKTLVTYRDCRAEPVKASEVNEITGEDMTQPWELDGDPYFGHLLATGAVKLSPDAQHVLDLLDALWVKSLPKREAYYESRPVSGDEPDLHLTAWDAGAYQLKHLFRDQFKEDWEELREAHRALADRLQEGVYTYGFLRR